MTANNLVDSGCHHCHAILSPMGPMGSQTKSEISPLASDINGKSPSAGKSDHEKKSLRPPLVASVRPPQTQPGSLVHMLTSMSYEA